MEDIAADGKITL